METGAGEQPRRQVAGQLLAITAAAVLTCGLIALAAPASGAGARARNGLILYERGTVLGSDIYAVRPTGASRHRVARGGSAPAPTPGGRRIVFDALLNSGYEALEVIDLDGKHRQRILDSHDTEPSYGLGHFDRPSVSPDGKEIVFDDRASSIWEVNVDGSNLAQLRMFVHSVSPLSPVFSPGGKTILITEAGGRGHNGLFIMDADGTNLRPVPHTISGGDGSFSPSGRWIVFIRGYGMFRIRPNGSGLHRIALAPSDAEFSSPKYSPDGRKIVFDEVVHGAKPLLGVFVTNANGSHTREVGPDGVNPSWASLP